MTNTRLLLFFLFLLAVPAVGLFFLLGFVGSWIAGIGAAGIIALLIRAARSSIAATGTIRNDVLIFAVTVSLLLCLLGGEGRLFFANIDWLVRDAIVHDLVSQPWPFVYRVVAPDGVSHEFLLRAPLAMYMLPTAVGKVAGVYAAHLALLAQNTILFALTFYFLVPAHFTFRQATALIVIFAAFSGLDVVPVAVRYLLTGSLLSNGITPADHLEPWAGLLQYSSHITQLFWAPQHAIPGWAFAGLFLLWKRGSVRAGVLVGMLPFLAWWSPFAAIGAAPFAIYAAASDWRGGKIGRADIAVVALAAIPGSLLGIYLRLGNGTVEHQFMLAAPGFWSVYFTFILVEFLPYAYFVGATRREALRDVGFLLAVGSLLVIPLYKLGASNDFAMRASIPALALLAAYFGATLVATVAAGERRVLTVLGTLILTIGAITGAMEVRRALVNAPAPISACDFVQAWTQSPFAWIPMTSYLVDLDTVPDWMRPHAAVEVPPSGTASRCFG